MSRLAKKPVVVPAGVQINYDKKSRQLKIKGPKGELAQEITGAVQMEYKDNGLYFTNESKEPLDRAKLGLYWSIAQNMVEGVTKGYEKRLEIVGAGFRADLKGKDQLNLFIGFNTKIPKIYKVDPKVTVKTESNGLIIVLSGIDKQKVGQEAAAIRNMRRADPYKGKGIRYVGEVVRKLAGKSVAMGKK
ncbi:MAG: 50S ribosomal protein L6 [Planctomycetota bacterium]